MSARQPLPTRELPFARLDEVTIDPSDETFRVRRRHRPELLASIRERGIRTPLIVQHRPPHGDDPGERDAGRQGEPGAGYRIVSGWGRWTGRPQGAKVPCFLLAGDLSPEGAWDAFLCDNETWNVAEIGRILARLEAVEGLDEERIIREKLPLLGVHPSRDLYRRYRRLADLGPEASALVEEESLPLRRAAVLLRLPPEAADSLVGAARGLRLTLSELSEAIECVEEVATRDLLGPVEVLSKVRAAAARPGKEAFLAALQALRYPELARLRDRLEGLRAKLELPPGAKVGWDPNLERPGIRLVADLPDRASLESLRDALAREEAGFDALFEVL